MAMIATVVTLALQAWVGGSTVYAPEQRARRELLHDAGYATLNVNASDTIAVVRSALTAAPLMLEAWKFAEQVQSRTPQTAAVMG